MNRMRSGLMVILLLASLAALAGPAVAGEIALATTLAGLAGAPARADGTGPNARFNVPSGVAISPDGALALVTDSRNNTIRRIDLATRRVTTLAGSPGVGGSNDGTGPAALFDYPTGVALSGDGSFALVADTDNHTIRRVDVLSGTVTTLAGRAGLPGSTDGTSGTAQFRAPQSIAISRDGSFALVADTDNHTVRRINIVTGAATTLAGSAGQPGNTDGLRTRALFDSPRGVALGPGDRYALVADSGNHTIRRIDLTTGQVATLAGSPGTSGMADGQGRRARFAYPRNLAISADGRQALVADFSSSTVRRIDLATGTVVTLAGAAGQPGSTDGAGALLRFPSGVALDPAGAFVLVADSENHTIRQLRFVAADPQVYLPLLR